MKKLLLPLLPLALFASQDVEQKIESLEQQLKELKAQVKENSQNINEDTSILEDVETKSILDKINFSPEILLRLDKFSYDNGKIINPDGSDENTKIHGGDFDGLQRRDEYSKNFELAAYVRFRLNMNFELDNVKFHGRLLYANSTQSNERLCILSRDIKSGTGGSAFDVDRAYVDYTLNSQSQYPFTLSFGILPTSGGTPMQYAETRPRESLFPALVFEHHNSQAYSDVSHSTQNYLNRKN